jgi:hypothetical protein
LSFHEAHFSHTPRDHFSTHFLGSVDTAEAGICNDAEYEDNDGLGYYEDGVKRTITDEQIAMFRHSEIQALLKERRHAEEAKSLNGASHSEEDEGEILEQDDDIEVNEEVSASQQCPRNEPQKKGKKGKKQEQSRKSFYKQYIKPDLRKRTWDKVETGLASLDYEEEKAVPSTRQSAPQRRKISYDDM